MTENDKLYPFLKEAADNGWLTWTNSTNEETVKVYRRAVSLNFLSKDISTKTGKFNGTIRLTEKGQKVVDASGDFSVVDEQLTTINVTASNANVGDNFGTINQTSENSNNKDTNKARIRNSVIGIVIARLAGLLVWFLTTQVF
ncbi:MAG: hypothetical protein GY816_01655 [Cytophagales bacterium]|nr:hypothetical protein [Cytophagales bacterium]